MPFVAWRGDGNGACSARGRAARGCWPLGRLPWPLPSGRPARCVEPRQECLFELWQDALYLCVAELRKQLGSCQLASPAAGTDDQPLRGP
jgi:hypothetical protein